MADGGWIKSFRRSVGSLPWSSGDLFKLWHLCLYKASFDDRHITFNGMVVPLNRGQFVTGRTAMRDQMNDGVKPAQQVNSSFVWRGLKKFEKAGMLNISSNPKYSVITIVNWDKYQESEQLPNSYRTATEQQTDTNKNYKNEKKEKKEDSQHSRKREYADDSPEMIEAVYLWEKIKGNNPEHRKPNLQSWADDIRKMNQLDHRPFEKIHKMIDWCQLDTFWQTNILSASKLRSKYDTMAAQANRKFSSGRRLEHTETKENWGYGVD